MINKKLFYQKIRDVKLFLILTQLQVKCLDILIDEWDKTQIEDLRQFAYLLGTIYHETGKQMIPVREKGNPKYLIRLPYYPFISRGFISFKWEDNYKRFGAMLGIDLVDDPEKIMQPKTAAKIAIAGMTEGKFTGVKLSNYFTSTKEDWQQARRVINGIDCADKIAAYARAFDLCLVEL